MSKKEEGSTEKECVIFPVKEQIHRIKKNANGFREEFYNTIDVEKGSLKHRIVIGDICAIETSSSSSSNMSGIIQGKKQNYPPFVHKKWIVGQVLALSCVKESVTKTSWCATIRWMARFDITSKEATGYIQSDEELTRFTKGSSTKGGGRGDGGKTSSSSCTTTPGVQFRQKQALLETNTVLVVPVADILPADLCIRNSTDFLNKNQMDHEYFTTTLPDGDILDTDPPAYKVFFHCVARCTEETVIVPNNAENNATAASSAASTTSATNIKRQLHDVREEWAKYREQRFSNDDAHDDAGPPPPPLQRGWDLLAHGSELQQALRQAYTKRSGDVFSAAGGTAAAASASVTSSSKQQRGDRGALSTKTNSKISSSTSGKKNSTFATASSLKKKAPATTREQPTKKKNRDLAGKRKASAKSSAAAPTNQKKTKKSRSSETCDDEESDNDDSDDDDDSQEVVVLNPRPIGDVVYELQIPAATQKPKKKKGRTAPPRIITTTRFVQGIELNVDREALLGDLRREITTSDDARWSFGVGDVIALRCEGARKPIPGPVPTKSVWYPFSVPWYPVQVVAIYSKDNNDDQAGDDDNDDCPYQMQVRWLTRFADLHATVKKKLSPEDKKLLQGDNAAYMVIEDDSSEAQEVSIEAALGNAVMTSKTKPSSTWLKVFLSKKSGKKKTRLPQVPLICCFQCGKDGSNLERIDDWTDYHESVEEGPMARGLALGMPGQHQRLRQEYEAGILGNDKSVVSTKASKSQKRKSTDSSSSRKRSKREESRQAESNSSDCGMDLSDKVSSAPTVFDHQTTPLGDVVYIMPAAKQRKEPIHFVEGVEMDVDPLSFHPDVRLVDATGSSRRWRLRVGDLVALREDSSKTNKGLSRGKSKKHKWYPFVKPWSAAQVLAIYRRGGNNSTTGYQMQVRWFSRPEELITSVTEHLTRTAKQELLRSKNAAHMVVELDECVYEKRVETALGHVVTTSELSPPSSWLQNFLSRKRLPQVPLICRYLQNTKDDDPILDRVDDWTNYGHSLVGPLSRGLLCPKAMPGGDKTLRKRYEFCVCHRYQLTDQTLQEFASDEPEALNALPSESDVASLSSFESTSVSIAASSGSTSQSSNHVGTSKPPFHMDKASGTSFFPELTIASGDDSWTVKLGDPVAVEHNMCAGPAKFGSMPNNTKRTKFWPLKSPWAVGEVVMIAKRSTSRMDKSEDDDCGFDMEVRWFYRSSEIPGSTETDDEHSCEEIFESDHYDTVSASSLLAPIVLHEHPLDIPEEEWYLGMPVVNFVCRRFWSCHRKSLVPCAGLGSRISRGRLQSTLIGKDTALAAAVEKIGDRAAEREQIQTTSQAPTDWRTAFGQVIHKLSLTDASKVALEDAAALVGREKEKTEIMSFLRTAITGKGEQGTKGEDKASMFIAGAPGVGKTACVRAVVRELKEQQSEGLIPKFDFIGLNGMEMRHPFEAYAQLWERLHVADKVQCSPELAVKKLETYFTGQTSATTGEKVVVLLLDEIDYLLTKTQSVLYHFFDWPRRASHNRLIVIGVSNTVNLPERLQSKVQSRIGSCRCSFKAYNSKEIAAILESKMEQASPRQKVFDNDAILFVSKKTASMSGDIRKAFNICRSAAELVMSEAAADSQQTSATEGPVVRIKHVSKVSRESFNSAQSHAVSMCTSFEVLLLVSLASLSKTTGREVGGFDVEELLVKMESIANSSGDRQYLPAPSLSETLPILSRLGEAQLIAMVTPQATSIGYRSCIAGSGGPWPVVSLVIDSVQLLLALKTTPHHLLGDKYLAM